MKKVWINPAYKDMVQVVKPEVNKEEKPVIKEQVATKPEKKEERKDNSMVIITENVLEKLKEREISTDKLIDLVNKEFTKESLREELKKRNIPEEHIIKILRRFKGKKEQKPSPLKHSINQSLEHKLFKHLMDKEILIEARLANGETFTGIIKWYTEWLISLAVDGKLRTVIIPRLMIVYYTQLQENSLSEKEINQLPLSNVTGVEVNILQQFKDNKIPLIFHMQGGMEIKGILDWYEKLVYHIKSPDGKTEHTLHRGNIVYFEEAM